MGMIDAAGAFSVEQDLAGSATGNVILSTNWVDMLSNTGASPAGEYLRDWGAGNPFYVTFTIHERLQATLGLSSALTFQVIVFADSADPPTYASTAAVVVAQGDLIPAAAMEDSPGLASMSTGKFSLAVSPIAGQLNNPVALGHRYLRVGYSIGTTAGADTLSDGIISAHLSMTPDVMAPASPTTGLGDALPPGVYPASVNRAGNG